MKIHSKENRQAWYDARVGMWTYITVDGSGNQIGEAEYSDNRKLVMQWLATGQWSFGVAKRPPQSVILN